MSPSGHTSRPIARVRRAHSEMFRARWGLTAGSCRGQPARVVVDAQEIDGRASQRDILIGKLRPGRTEHLADFGGVLAAEDWVEKLAVHISVGPYLSLAIGARSRCRILGSRFTAIPIARGCPLRDRPEPPVHARGAGSARRARLRPGRDAPVPGSLLMTPRHHPRLVQATPSADAISERAVEQTGVVREPVGDVAVRPSPPFIQGHRQVPVIKGY